LSLSTSSDNYFIHGFKEKNSQKEDVFYIKTNGDAFFSGNIEANGGKLGSWEINKKETVNDEGKVIDTYFTLQSVLDFNTGFVLRNKYKTEDAIFFVGGEDDLGTNALLKIGGDGDLKMTGGNFILKRTNVEGNATEVYVAFIKGNDEIAGQENEKSIEMYV
jgi:hypothetical protein